jgi:glycosyltransferase involved in cell wall biosynthesis
MRELRFALEPLSADRGNGTAPQRWRHHPCLTEESAIGSCMADVMASGVGEVIVVDGESTDRTAERAAAAGAKFIVEPARGYGRAMLSGLAALAPTSSIVLCIDGDGSDRPDMIPSVLEPIESGRADFVLGSRLRGERDPGSLGAAQIVARHLLGFLIRLLYGVRFTDMSPFRAIRRDVLENLGMIETTFGWNLELQMRVAAAGLRVMEVPVGQRRRRDGVSKVSGDWRTAARATLVLLQSFPRLAWQLRRTRRSPFSECLGAKKEHVPKNGLP